MAREYYSRCGRISNQKEQASLDTWQFYDKLGRNAVSFANVAEFPRNMGTILFELAKQAYTAS